MSFEDENNNEIPLNDKKGDEKGSDNNLDYLLETINKQIAYLKDKYKIIDYQEMIKDQEKDIYHEEIEKIKNNKDLYKLKVDEKY